MFTNPFLQNFFAYSQQNPWAQATMQQPNPQMMLGSQMPMYQPPMMEPPMQGLLGKAGGNRPGYLAPISGKPIRGTGDVHIPRQGDRFMAVRG